MAGRARVHLNIGNLLELAAAGIGCWAVWRLAGLSWTLVAVAVLVLVAAELVYDASSITIPLPRRPRPALRACQAARAAWAAAGRAGRPFRRLSGRLRRCRRPLPALRPGEVGDEAARWLRSVDTDGRR